MERWAFATSLPPYGLGLSSAEFWWLSLEEYDAKVACWERYTESQFIMLAHIRADIHNGQCEKRDKSMWTAQDFGAPAVKQKDPRRKYRPQEIIPRLRAAFPAMRDKAGNKISAVANLKGQPLQPRKRA